MNTNKIIRDYMLAKNDVTKCRITKGEVHIYTDRDRGDGGRSPWWMLYSDVETAEQEAKEAAGYAWVRIPMEPTGTGNIYNLGSSMETRVIEFRPDDKFALVSPAYFGRYWRVGSDEDASEAAEKHANYHPVIIDRDGNIYDPSGHSLTATGITVYA